MKIGYLQNDPIFGEKKKNFKDVRQLIKSSKTDLLVLPELFATGYTFTSAEEARNLAEKKDGATATYLKEISLQIEGTVIGGFIELEDDKVYNALLIVSKGKVIDTYKKIHLFNRENLWFTPGDEAPKVYEIDGLKIGVMICFDWIFPETCRSLALQGMQVLAHPSNLDLPHCQSAMITRCIENRIFAITANRIGNELRGGDEFSFTGKSQITSWNGKTLTSATEDKVGVGIVEIDEKEANNKQINAFNDLIKNRRSNLYDL